MSDNSKINDGYMNDPSWARFFEMAESYKEQDDIPVYDNIM